MIARPLALAAVVILGAVALSGCTPVGAPSPTKTAAGPSPQPTSQSTEPAPDPLPDNAILGFNARATASNGAKLDIAIVVLKPEPWDSPLGLPRSSATTTWCGGELDTTVYPTDSGWSFAQVDVTATLAKGSSPWPTDVPLQILPLPGGPSLTAAGDLHQVEAPSTEPGDYVPHCVQNVFLDGVGSGSVYLGFDNDATTWTKWAFTDYGVTLDGIATSADPTRATLTNCSTVVTTLGESLGGTPDIMTQHFSPTTCQVGA